MTANRQNEKPLHKSRWMPMICIIYGIMLLWMLEVGAVKYHFYFVLAPISKVLFEITLV